MEKNNWEEMYKKEHKLRQEVEGELTIVKTITIDSSPEMRETKKEIVKLKKEICELRQDNRKLSQQVEESLIGAQEDLRIALSFSARTEKPYVSKHIADMLHNIDNLIRDNIFPYYPYVFMNRE